MEKTYLNRNKSVRIKMFDHLLTQQDSLTEPDQIGLYEAQLWISSSFGGEHHVATGFGETEEVAAANAHQLWTADRMRGPQDV
jgi:hypothetical protein